MKYNFDEVIERKESYSIKWDGLEERFSKNDLIPMWVADMDFKSPKPVIDALKNRVDHGIFGYTFRPSSYSEAIINWLRKRHKWEILEEWIAYSPAILPGISFIIQSLTLPGDKIIIQPPVYYPFFEIIKNSGRYIVENCLRLYNDKYYMDFDDLIKKVKDSKTKILILCNPHNPVGRVWTEEELLKLGKICIKNNILIISDEIHSDIILNGNKHTPFAKISKKFSLNSITCISPSKTFNLAGLQTAAMIIPNNRYMSIYNNVMEMNRIRKNNIFGMVALIAAYNYGEEWLDQLLDYLQGNLNFLIKFINKNIPNIGVIKPEGTYLVWLDCRELLNNFENLDNFFIDKAKIALDSGYWFGLPGRGFMRINIACPRHLLEKGLENIKIAVKNIE